MANFDTLNRPGGELEDSTANRYTLSDIEPKAGLGNDDSPFVVKAMDKISLIGGGELVIDKPIILTADLDVPRLVIPRGCGSARSIIMNDGTQRRITVRGLPADAPFFNGDTYTVHGLMFDGVSLVFGDASLSNTVDSPRGMRAAFCDFHGSDYALKFVGQYPQGPDVNNKSFNGIGALFCNFRVCDFGVIFRYAGPSSFVTNCLINEMAEASVLVDVVALDGISLFITDTYADHCLRFLKTQGSMIGDGQIQIRGGGVELCGTNDLGSAYSAGDAYCIENDGANIFIDGTQIFAGPHTDAVFWNKSGNILWRPLSRNDWAVNQLVRIDDGIVCIDQSMMFSGPKLWGEGAAGEFHHTSSTGGKIMASRGGFWGRTNFDMGPSAGNPLDSTHTLSQPIDIFAYDYNDRVFEAEIQTTVAGTTYNALRVYLNDGTHTNQIDLVLPNILGGGLLKIYHKPGVELSAAIHFLPSAYTPQGNAAANPPTQTEFNAFAAKFNAEHAYFVRATTSDAATVTVSRQLQLQTIAPTGTQATIYVRNLSERIVGPKVVGL